MLTATMLATADTATIRITAGDQHVATYRVGHADGPGPIPVANAVLDRHGWRIVRDWEQTAGGISSDQWETTIEQAEEA